MEVSDDLAPGPALHPHALGVDVQHAEIAAEQHEAFAHALQHLARAVALDPERFFGGDLVDDLGVDAEPSGDLTGAVPNGLDPRQERPEHAVGAPQGKHHLERLACRDRGRPALHHRWEQLRIVHRRSSPSLPSRPAWRRSSRTIAD
jgi:hypothetical protein